MINNLTNISFDAEKGERNATEECFTTSDKEQIKTVKMIAYVFILIAGLTGNVLVSLIIYRNKKMRTSANYFILNMSISDILFLLILMPRKILESFVGFRGWLIEGVTGEIFCKLVYYTQDITVAVSIQSIVVLAADRFMAVMFPMRAGAIMSRARRFIIPSTWLFGMVIHAPYLYTFKLKTKSNGQTKCVYSWGPDFDPVETERIYSIIIFIFLSLLPISLITVLYSAIMVKLNRQKIPPGEINFSTRGRRTQLKERQRQNQKVSKLVIAVVVGFIVIWAPYNTYVILVIFVQESSCHVELLHVISSLIGFSYPVVNPAIYFIFSENYRQGIKNIFRRGSEHGESVHRIGTSRKTLEGHLESKVSINREFWQDSNGSPRMQFYRSYSQC